MLCDFDEGSPKSQSGPLWITPHGRVIHGPPLSIDQEERRFGDGWIYVKPEADGSLTVRHRHATRYADQRLKQLVRQHASTVDPEISDGMAPSGRLTS